MPAKPLHETVRGATVAVIVAQMASQLISLAALAVLWRLVDRSDFGLVGMVVPLLLLLRTFGTLGLNVAGVQQRQLSPGEASSLFWLQLALGVAVAAAMAACAPLLAWAYRAPAVTAIALALAGTSIVAALGAQHQALLERKLQFGRLSVVRLLGQTIGSAAGIAAAVGGWGVWALVVQQYAELLVISAAAWIAQPWRPFSPLRGESIRSLIRFGGYYTASGLMFALAQNLDKILLAFFLGATKQGQAMLGMYTQAFNLMMKPVYLVTSPITGVMLPALSRARHDRGAYRQLLCGFYRMVGIALLPCGVGLFLVGDDVMVVLGGDAWHQAGMILVALAPAILAAGFINIAGSVFASAGRADRLFLGSAAIALVMNVAVAGGLYLGTIAGPPQMGTALGVAGAYAAALTLVVFIPYMIYCFRTVGVKTTDVLVSLAGPLLASTAMGVVVGVVRFGPFGVDSLPAAGRLAVLVAAGVVAYLFFARRELRWLIGRLTKPPTA